MSRTVLVVPPVARFEAIVEAFTGPLPAPQAGVLRRWLRATSVAVVWRALEPGLRQGGQAARRQLFARLADWQR